MIVDNTGYKKLEDVIALIKKKERFIIYKTHKDTEVLVISEHRCGPESSLYYPDKSRAEWKLVEDKKIASIEAVFDSETDSIDSLDTSGWNNGEQIMSYVEYNR